MTSTFHKTVTYSVVCYYHLVFGEISNMDFNWIVYSCTCSISWTMHQSPLNGNGIPFAYLIIYFWVSHHLSTLPLIYMSTSFPPTMMTSQHHWTITLPENANPIWMTIFFGCLGGIMIIIMNDANMYSEVGGSRHCSGCFQCTIYLLFTTPLKGRYNLNFFLTEEEMWD